MESFGKTGISSRGMGSLGTLTGLRAGGEEFPIEASISQVEVGGRKLFTVILRDVTERARAEAALRQSETELQTIVENLTEGLSVSDLDGQLLHFNRAALDLHGFASLEESRRHLTEFADTFELSDMDGTVLPLEQWPLARILRGETLSDLEVRIRRLQGDWRRIFSYGGTLVRETGRPTLAIVTISDITERVRAENEIRQLNTELEGRVGSARRSSRRRTRSWSPSPTPYRTTCGHRCVRWTGSRRPSWRTTGRSCRRRVAATWRRSAAARSGWAS